MSRVAVPEPDYLMKPEQLAQEWQISAKTLANQRSKRQGPPFVKISGGTVRYSRKAVDAWLDELRRNSEYAPRSA